MKFTRTFSADVGQKSVGAAGPDQIEHDLDQIAKQFDPLQPGGGIAEENIQNSAVTAPKLANGAVIDDKVGSRTIFDETAPSGDSGLLTSLLGWLANMVKQITGKSSWRTPPATTLEAAKAHIDASAPHPGHETIAGAQAKVDAHATLTNNPHNTTAQQIGAIVNVGGITNPGGGVDVVGLTGISIGKDHVNKRITITATGAAIPANHAAAHEIGGADPINVTSLGAIRLGVNNNVVDRVRTLIHQIDTRTVEYTYNPDGTLNMVVEKSGAMPLRTTTMGYVDGMLKTVTEVADGVTVISTFNYVDGNLMFITKGVF